jgi:5'-deoxynucleotidase YfbR-like HD superfamily hydrolase
MGTGVHKPLDKEMKLLESFLRMRDVQRLSATAKFESYNLLEHSGGVLFLFLEICDREGIDVQVYEIKKVFLHDILETETGDLLYTAKNLNSITKENFQNLEDEVLADQPHLFPYSDKGIAKTLSAQALKAFKEADLLELLLFCSRQSDLGNKDKRLQFIITNCKRLLEGSYKTTQEIIEKYVQ